MVAFQDDVPLEDRAELRRHLVLPPTCDHDSIAADAGLRLYPRGETTVVAALCSSGAYNLVTAWFWIEGAITHPKRIVRLRFDTWQFGTPPRRAVVEFLAGHVHYDSSTATITVFTKARGMGDCGVWAKFVIASARAIPVEMRVKERCDGESLPFDTWELMPP